MMEHYHPMKSARIINNNAYISNQMVQQPNNQSNIIQSHRVMMNNTD